ncbi:MAG: beta-ketoacyl synthase chain length factor [Gammaproteobacteria bacterium]|nr:beta-ketoacyl synthase chain length factor [Gammaproteobacteria bacterium]
MVAQSHQPSLSISAGENSFAVGLMESFLQCNATKKPILYVAYDMTPPMFLNKHVKTNETFAVALLLSPQKTTASLANISVNYSQQSATQLTDADLEILRLNSAAARSLSLLEKIILKKNAIVYLQSGRQQCLEVNVQC